MSGRQRDEWNTSFPSHHPCRHCALLPPSVTRSPDPAAAPRVLLRDAPALLAPDHAAAELGQEVLDDAPQLDGRAGLVVLLRDHAPVLVVYQVDLGHCKHCVARSVTDHMKMSRRGSILTNDFQVRDQDDGRVRGDLAEVGAVVPPQGGPHAQPPVVGPLEGHRVARVQAERVPAHGEDVESGPVPAEPRDLRRLTKLTLAANRQTDPLWGFLGRFFTRRLDPDIDSILPLVSFLAPSNKGLPDWRCGGGMEADAAYRRRHKNNTQRATEGEGAARRGTGWGYIIKCERVRETGKGEKGGEGRSAKQRQSRLLL